MAILAFERPTKRGYQFEDGKLRLFKEGFYHLMKPVDRPADETMELVAQLDGKLARAKARRNADPLPIKPPAGVFSLDDRLAALLNLTARRINASFSVPHDQRLTATRFLFAKVIVIA